MPPWGAPRSRRECASILPPQPTKRLQGGRSYLDPPSARISQSSARSRPQTTARPARCAPPAPRAGPPRSTPVVVRGCVEFRGDGILGSAQEDRRSRQRFVRQGVDQLMELGLGHQENGTTGPSSVSGCREFQALGFRSARIPNYRRISGHIRLDCLPDSALEVAVNQPLCASYRPGSRESHPGGRRFESA